MSFIFIVFRVQILNNLIEKNLHIDLVHKIREEIYDIYDILNSIIDKTCQRNDMQDANFGDILGLSKTYYVSMSSSTLKIKQFMGLPLAKPI